MTNTDYVKLLKEIQSQEIATQKTKGHDYACDNDTLQNFKVVSAMAKALKLDVTEPWGAAMFFKLVKIQRFVNLCHKGEAAQNESRIDTVIDDRAYTLLAEACYRESKGE